MTIGELADLLNFYCEEGKALDDVVLKIGKHSVEPFLFHRSNMLHISFEDDNVKNGENLI